MSTDSGEAAPHMSLSEQYIAISKDLVRCLREAAKLHGIDEPYSPPTYPSTTYSSTNYSSPTVPKGTSPASKDVEVESELASLPPIPSLLREHHIRLRIFERETGIIDEDWLSSLNQTHGVRGLLESTFASLDEGCGRMLDMLTQGLPYRIHDEQWREAAIQRCHAIGYAVYQMTELQPLLQMFRASHGTGKGPLAKQKRIIASIGDQHEMELDYSRFTSTSFDNSDTVRGADGSTQTLSSALCNDLGLFLDNITLFLSKNGFFSNALWFDRTVCLASVPFLVFSPIWVAGLIALGFKAAHDLLCAALNSGAQAFDSCVASDYEAYKGEAWIFLGQFGVNGPVLRDQLHQLAIRFQRRIETVPSETSGILPDFLSSLLLRRLSSTTNPYVRDALSLVKREILDPKVSRVVIIAYSSGAIHASLVVDRLLLDCPRDLLAKLEIFTLGAFCTQFHNPLLSRDQEGPEPSYRTSSISERLIPHMEHFAFKDDPFARMGVLAQFNGSNIQGTVFELAVSLERIYELGHTRSGGRDRRKGGDRRFSSYLEVLSRSKEDDRFPTSNFLVVRKNNKEKSPSETRMGAKSDRPLGEQRESLRNTWPGVSRLSAYTNGKQPATEEVEIRQQPM